MRAPRWAVENAVKCLVVAVELLLDAVECLRDAAANQIQKYPTPLPVPLNHQKERTRHNKEKQREALTLDDERHETTGT